MVVGRHLHDARRVEDRPYRERASSAGRRRGRGHAAIERRHPQLLGAQPRRQAGSDPGTRRPTSSCCRQGPACIAAQCAEFCGIQHANMALVVTVESKADFLRWVAQQRRPAFAPGDPARACRLPLRHDPRMQCCHNIAGTPAGGQVGPDLTHLASRRTHRGRHAADEQRQSLRLGRRPAVAKARQQDADDRPCAGRAPRGRRLSARG